MTNKVLFFLVALVIASLIKEIVFGRYRHNSLSKLIDKYEEYSLNRHRRKEIEKTRKLLDEQKKEHTEEINE